MNRQQKHDQPQNEVEKMLLKILQKIIKDNAIPGQNQVNCQISMTSTFAEEMNSLLIISYISQVEEHYNIEIPLHDLYKIQTLRSLAGKIMKISGMKK